MQLSKGLFTIVSSFCLFAAACSGPAVKAPVPGFVVPTGPPGDRAVLAGEWEYEEGAVTVLRLDEQGNGTYDWKEGRFETTALNGRIWQGMWSQTENDREGGFTVELSSDFTEGDGRWWYTRIGEDRAPSQKGGTFHVSKRTASAALTPSPAPR